MTEKSSDEIIKELIIALTNASKEKSKKRKLSSDKSSSSSESDAPHKRHKSDDESSRKKYKSDNESHSRHRKEKKKDKKSKKKHRKKSKKDHKRKKRTSRHSSDSDASGHTRSSSHKKNERSHRDSDNDNLNGDKKSDNKENCVNVEIKEKIDSKSIKINDELKIACSPSLEENITNQVSENTPVDNNSNASINCDNLDKDQKNGHISPSKENNNIIESPVKQQSDNSPIKEIITEVTETSNGIQFSKQEDNICALHDIPLPGTSTTTTNSAAPPPPSVPPGKEKAIIIKNLKDSLVFQKVQEEAKTKSENSNTKEDDSLEPGEIDDNIEIKNTTDEPDNNDINSENKDSEIIKKKRDKRKYRGRDISEDTKDNNKDSEKKKKRSRSRSRSHRRSKRTRSKDRSRSRDRTRSRDRRKARSKSRDSRKGRSRSKDRRSRSRDIRSRSKHRSSNKRSWSCSCERDPSKRYTSGHLCPRHKSKLKSTRHSPRKSSKSEMSRSVSRSKSSKRDLPRSSSRGKSSKRDSPHSLSRGKSAKRENETKESNNRDNSPDCVDYLRDKASRKKLLEVAKRNAVYLMKNSSLSIPFDAETATKNLGKSVEELTNFCKQLASKSDESDLSDINDTDIDAAGENPFGVARHPFLVKDKPIVMNIRNAPMIKPKTNAERLFDQTKLREQFPVSSGTQHRTKAEDGWVPVEKIDKETEKVFPDKEVEPPVNIAELVSARVSAMRKLQDNPYDQEAKSMLNYSQKEMADWARSKQTPGQFTGTPLTKIMSHEELSSGRQAWARKEQLKEANPVNSHFGLKMLQKMGWNPGEGLGKNKEGNLEPLMLDVKTDKKGLHAQEEVSMPKPKVPPPIASKLAGKHPVSALIELCSKKRWGVPVFHMIFDSGPDHKKNFLMKVIVNGKEFKPPMPVTTKKVAKATAATSALQALGVLPKESVSLSMEQSKNQENPFLAQPNEPSIGPKAPPPPLPFSPPPLPPNNNQGMTLEEMQKTATPT